MKRSKIFIISFILTLTCLFAAAQANAEFNLFKGMKKIEADPQKDYKIKDSDGLWFIMAKNFRGDDAEQKALELVLEFRKKYKLESFIFKYDPDKSELDDLGKNSPVMKKYKYNTDRVTEYSVLVGSFPNVDDVTLQKTFLTVKRCKPDCLQNDQISQRLIQKYEEMAKKNPEFAGYGPLGGAIIVPNPLIDKDFYNQKGIVDPFVEKINSDSKYSLLNNKKLYTLRVATFRGDCSIIKNTKENDKNLMSKLRFAGLKAAALCEALRQKGIEAWEFHDRDSSFVTIGSFDSYGTSRSDGYIELNPEINELMKKYQGTAAPGTNGAFTTKMVTVEISDPSEKNKKEKRVDIPFDIQPLIIAVPQKPENFKKALLAVKQQKMDHQINEVKKEEASLSQSDHERNYRKNYRQQIAQNPNAVLNENGQNPNTPVSLAQNGSNGQNQIPNRSFSQAVYQNSTGQARDSYQSNAGMTINGQPGNQQYSNQSMTNQLSANTQFPNPSTANQQTVNRPTLSQNQYPQNAGQQGFAGQYPQANGQYPQNAGQQDFAGQYPQANGQYPQNAGQQGFAGQYPQANGQYPQNAGQQGFTGQYPQANGQYPQNAGQQGFAGQYPQANGQYPQNAGQQGFAGQYPQANGQYPQNAGQQGFAGQYPQANGQYPQNAGQQGFAGQYPQAPGEQIAMTPNTVNQSHFQQAQTQSASANYPQQYQGQQNYQQQYQNQPQLPAPAANQAPVY